MRSHLVIRGFYTGLSSLNGVSGPDR